MVHVYTFVLIVYIYIVFFRNIDTHCTHSCANTLKQISWEPAPPEWVTLNSDGSVLSESGQAAAGGLIRNSQGRCLAAFSMNLGKCSITRAELRGAVSGLQESNHAADYLANVGHSCPLGFHVLEQLDPNFCYWLRYDQLGVSEERLILNEV
ncbi:Putative ribonuclease H protein At1g65750 [Linum perenne]